MFNPASRYAGLEDCTIETPDGLKIAYKARRFLPQGEDVPQLGEVVLGSGERLDLAAARTLGDPLQYWQICDANNCLNPFDLAEESQAGRALRVPLPGYKADQ